MAHLLKRPPRLYELLVAELEEFLQDNKFTTGSRLPPESTLCQKFGVSRTVLRESIRVLVTRGVLKQVAGKGTFVSHSITQPLADVFKVFANRNPARGLAELFEVRGFLEVEIAGLAAKRATDEEIAKLEKLNRTLLVLHQEVGLSSEEVQHYNQLDFDFHLALAQCTHNQLFAVMITALSDSFKASWSVTHHASETRQHGIEMHARILDAIRAHDSVAARRATRENLAAFLADAQAHLKVGEPGNGIPANLNGKSSKRK